MCLEEFMSGNGLLTKEGETSIHRLKEELLEAYNKNRERNGEMTETKNQVTFSILHKRKEKLTKAPFTPAEVGKIDLNTKTGEFEFSIHEDLYTVELAEETDIFQTLLTFMKRLNPKEKEYGARTYYWNDCLDDELGNSTEGFVKHYGGWKKKTPNLLSDIS